MNIYTPWGIQLPDPEAEAAQTNTANVVVTLKGCIALTLFYVYVRSQISHYPESGMLSARVLRVDW